MPRTTAIPGYAWDAVAALVLCVAVLCYAFLFVGFDRPPFEDAAMLMRYAENVAGGHGIVWNIGEPPVDGATDFLFMGSVAALIRAGMPTGRAVRLLGLVAHLLTVLLVYATNRRLWNAGVVLSSVAALYVGFGAGPWYVSAYFGTPFFGLFAATTWCFGLILMEAKDQPEWASWGFAVSGLVAGLTRPEGVLLAGLAWVAVVVFRGWARSRRITMIFFLVMLVAGGAYFTWRWNYFGHPLPNPYYKKGSGILHWDSFREGLRYLVRFSGPFAIAFILGLRSRPLLRQTIAFLIPLVMFPALFVLVSNETNFGGRFQYAVWPMLVLAFFPLVRGLPQELSLSWKLPSPRLWRSAWILAFCGAVFGVLSYGADQGCGYRAPQSACSLAPEEDGRYDVAKLLAEYRGRGYVLATTEAGLLPLYSGWTAVDTWGLNDAWIARQGEVTADYLDLYRPHVLVFHAYFSPVIPGRSTQRDLTHDWHRMTLILQEYAESRDYVLAAAFGDSPHESHYYYVRRDFPDSERIAKQIAGVRTYTWYATGKKAVNYAQVEDHN